VIDSIVVEILSIIYPYTYLPFYYSWLRVRVALSRSVLAVLLTNRVLVVIVSYRPFLALTLNAFALGPLRHA
jgi:hypothetical protein